MGWKIPGWEKLYRERKGRKNQYLEEIPMILLPTEVKSANYITVVGDKDGDLRYLGWVAITCYWASQTKRLREGGFLWGAGGKAATTKDIATQRRLDSDRSIRLAIPKLLQIGWLCKWQPGGDHVATSWQPSGGTRKGKERKPKGSKEKKNKGNEEGETQNPEKEFSQLSFDSDSVRPESFCLTADTLIREICKRRGLYRSRIQEKSDQTCFKGLRQHIELKCPTDTEFQLGKAIGMLVAAATADKPMACFMRAAQDNWIGWKR